MVSSDAVANIRYRFGKCQASRETHGKSAPSGKAGGIKNLELGLDFHVYQSSSPASLSPILFVYSYYTF